MHYLCTGMTRRGTTKGTSLILHILPPVNLKLDYNLMTDWSMNWRGHVAEPWCRRRMDLLNKGFDRLRGVLPGLGPQHQLSKYETLQLAQSYISELANLLQEWAQACTACSSELNRALPALESSSMHSQHTTAHPFIVWIVITSVAAISRKLSHAWPAAGSSAILYCSSELIRGEGEAQLTFAVTISLYH